MNTFVFQPGMTWRKLGFALHSNSLEYRKVLENNPIWDISKLPPPGTVLRGSLNGSPSAGASQQPSVYTQLGSDSFLEFFPFDSQIEYYAALVRYSPSSLRKVERINGLTSDSSPALTGRQVG